MSEPNLDCIVKNSRLVVRSERGVYYALFMKDEDIFDMHFISADGCGNWIFKNRFSMPIQEIEERQDNVLIRVQGGPDLIFNFEGKELGIFHYT